MEEDREVNIKEEVKILLKMSKDVQSLIDNYSTFDDDIPRCLSNLLDLKRELHGAYFRKVKDINYNNNITKYLVKKIII